MRRFFARKRKRALGISLPVLSSYDKGENYELF